MTRNCCGDGLDVAENLRKIRERIREACAACGRDESEVTLMAVTKTVPPERVNKALDAGVRLLGENRVQECCEKYQPLYGGANSLDRTLADKQNPQYNRQGIHDRVR